MPQRVTRDISSFETDVTLSIPCPWSAEKLSLGQNGCFHSVIVGGIDITSPTIQSIDHNNITSAQPGSLNRKADVPFNKLNFCSNTWMKGNKVQETNEVEGHQDNVKLTTVGKFGALGIIDEILLIWAQGGLFICKSPKRGFFLQFFVPGLSTHVLAGLSTSGGAGRFLWTYSCHLHHLVFPISYFDE